MKAIYFLSIAILFAAIFTSCDSVSYKKTKSGLLYKIYPGNGKDSLISEGKIVKFNFTAKVNDSVFLTSYGKMPGFTRVQKMDPPPYNLLEILMDMRKGDSAVSVQIVDTMIKRGMQDQLPPGAKKGDRITTMIRILEVFASDSLGMADYNAEMKKDMPRQMKEQEEQMAKENKQRQEQQLKEIDELEKSGEAAKQRKVVEDYLSSKKITAQKTEHGTYVLIKEQGSGPKAVAGKYLLVKYSGRRLATDSVFEANTYPLQVGMGSVIAGWDEGLQQFNEGGKGTLYVPAYMGYGNNPRPGGPIKPGDALIFDVEIIKVSDQPIQPGQ